jgi:hypothetical protein
MLLMTGNTRSGGVGQGRASFARRASGRSAAQGLDGRRSGGYFGHRCLHPVFSASSRAGTATFTRRNREHADSHPTDSFHTRSRTATCKRQPFRALWLYAAHSIVVPAEELQVTLQLPFWGDVSPYPADAKQRVLGVEH